MSEREIEHLLRIFQIKFKEYLDDSDQKVRKLYQLRESELIAGIEKLGEINYQLHDELDDEDIEPLMDAVALLKGYIALADFTREYQAFAFVHQDDNYIVLFEHFLPWFLREYRSTIQKVDVQHDLFLDDEGRDLTPERGRHLHTAFYLVNIENPLSRHLGRQLAVRGNHIYRADGGKIQHMPPLEQILRKIQSKLSNDEYENQYNDTFAKQLIIGRSRWSIALYRVNVEAQEIFENKHDKDMAETPAEKEQLKQYGLSLWDTKRQEILSQIESTRQILLRHGVILSSSARFGF